MDSLKIIKIEIPTKRNSFPLPERSHEISLKVYREKSKDKLTCDFGRDVFLKRVVLVILESRPQIWKTKRAGHSEWEKVGIEVYERTEQLIPVVYLRKMVTLCKSSIKRKLKICILNQNMDTVQTETAMWSLPYYAEFKYYRDTLKKFENDLRDTVFNKKFPPATDDEIQFIGFVSFDQCDDSFDDENDDENNENEEGILRKRPAEDEETEDLPMEVGDDNGVEQEPQVNEYQYQQQEQVNYYPQNYQNYQEHQMMEEEMGNVPVVGRYEEIGRRSISTEEDQNQGLEYNSPEAFYQNSNQPGPSSPAGPIDYDAVAIQNRIIQFFINYPERYEIFNEGVEKILDYLEKEDNPDTVKMFGDLKYMEELLENEKREQEEAEQAVKTEKHKEAKESIPKLL